MRQVDASVAAASEGPRLQRQGRHGKAVRPRALQLAATVAAPIHPIVRQGEAQGGVRH